MVPECRILEETVEVMRLVAQERVQRIDEEIVELSIPHATEDIVEELKYCSTEAVSERICAQVVGVPSTS